MQRKMFAVKQIMHSLYIHGIYIYTCTTYQAIAIHVNRFYEFERNVRAGSDISRVLQVPINGIWFLKIFAKILVPLYAAPN